MQFQKEHKFCYSINIIFLLIFTLLTLIQRQKKLIAQRRNVELERQISEMNSERELLHKEIELRNRKLSARALYLSGRNQLINNLIMSIENIPKLSKVSTLDIHIKHLKDYLKSDNEWEIFVFHFVILRLKLKS